MKTVLFITLCKYPNGDASAKRYEVFMRYFKDKGYQMIFLGMGNGDYKKEEIIDGVNVVSFRKYSKPNAIQKIINHAFIKTRILKYAIQKHFNADIVFVDPRFFKLFKRNKMHFTSEKIIYSAVEYYSPSEYRFNGLFSYSYKQNVYFNEKFKSNDGRIIAISSYLENVFKQRNIKTVRIPFVLNNKDNVQQIIERNDDLFKFIYCGNPRKKDSLLKMLIAFSNVSNECSHNFEVNIFGVTNEWLERQNIDREIKQVITSFTKFHGLKKYNFVSLEYFNNDFSILLRPEDERYAKAGFPTKISESLEHAIPPVTNFTSDLGLYLKDKYNCVECVGDTIDSFAVAIKKALALDKKQIVEMKRNAFKTAKEELDIHSFYNELDYILE